jgi:hypothetical protein
VEEASESYSPWRKGKEGIREGGTERRREEGRKKERRRHILKKRFLPLQALQGGG